MPRWEHGSKDRLKKAALELFDEQGFEKTSVINISERARVTTRTFFRYFPDKREVLFDGADELRALLVEKILQAPDVGEPLQVVLSALSEFDWEKMGPRDYQRRRQAVIAANPELLERDLIKNHSVVLGFIDALRRRGVEAASAELSARVGAQVFNTAYLRWLDAGKKADMTLISKQLMSVFASIVPTKVTAPASLPKKVQVPASSIPKSKSSQSQR
jgi:AcrR family transcriptional regulator